MAANCVTLKEGKMFFCVIKRYLQLFLVLGYQVIEFVEFFISFKERNNQRVLYYF